MFQHQAIGSYPASAVQPAVRRSGFSSAMAGVTCMGRGLRVVPGGRMTGRTSTSLLCGGRDGH